MIPKDKGVYAEGFFIEKGFMYRVEDRNFCFTVRKKGGRTKNVCVGRAYLYRPKAKVTLAEDEVIVELGKPGKYRVYPYTEKLIPKPIKEFDGNRINFKRGYNTKEFAITEVKGSVESEPLIVEVPKKKPEKPAKPEALSYILKGDKLYIYWTVRREVKGFLIYKNGKLLTPKPIIQNIFVDRVPDKPTRYEIVSVGERGLKSDPAILIYKP